MKTRTVYVVTARILKDPESYFVMGVFDTEHIARIAVLTVFDDDIEPATDTRGFHYKDSPYPEDNNLDIIIQDIEVGSLAELLRCKSQRYTGDVQG